MHNHFNMASPPLGFYLTILFLGSPAHLTDLKLPASVHQESSFVSRQTSGSLTLKCFYKGDVAARLYWYKQPLGQKPKLISTSYIYEKNNTFYGEFINNPRFTLDTKNNKNHLTITDLQTSDSATYYCLSSYLNILTFSESFSVIVEDADSNVQTLLQSSSETIEPGGSVTLNCTVHTGTCDGERSVYWFKRSSENSRPGLIYTHRGRDQCERKADAQTHTCVYNLPMNNLNVSHVGTYYCAVASCGHILFGNGTKLEFKYDVSTFWSSAFAFSSILSALLTFSVCMMSKKCDCKSSESQASPTKADAKGFREAETVFVAALNVNMSNRLRGQRDHTWSECVYSRVKQ